MEFGIEQVWAKILGLLPLVCVTSATFLDLLENLFLIRKMRILGWTSRIVINIKHECLGQEAFTVSGAWWMLREY